MFEAGGTLRFVDLKTFVNMPLMPDSNILPNVLFNSEVVTVLQGKGEQTFMPTYNDLSMHTIADEEPYSQAMREVIEADGFDTMYTFKHQRQLVSLVSSFREMMDKGYHTTVLPHTKDAWDKLRRCIGKSDPFLSREELVAAIAVGQSPQQDPACRNEHSPEGLAAKVEDLLSYILKFGFHRERNNRTRDPTASELRHAMKEMGVSHRDWIRKRLETIAKNSRYAGYEDNSDSDSGEENSPSTHWVLFRFNKFV